MACKRLAFLLLTIAMPIGIALHCPAASAAEAARSTFGVMPDGRTVDAITLSNQHGIRIRVISLGAALQSCVTPDGNGKLADIVLGYGDLKGYLSDIQVISARRLEGSQIVSPRAASHSIAKVFNCRSTTA